MTFLKSFSAQLEIYISLETKVFNAGTTLWHDVYSIEIKEMHQTHINMGCTHSNALNAKITPIALLLISVENASGKTAQMWFQPKGLVQFLMKVHHTHPIIELLSSMTGSTCAVMLRHHIPRKPESAEGRGDKYHFNMKLQSAYEPSRLP